MPDSNNDSKLFIPPLQIVEDGPDLLLRRGNSELVIEGEFYSQVVRLILKLISEGNPSRSQLTEYFAEPHREAVSQLLDNLVKRRFIAAAEPALVADQETPENRFFWHFEKPNQARPPKVVYLVGINHLTMAIESKLRRSGKPATALVDAPLLRDGCYTGTDGALDPESLKHDGWDPDLSPLTDDINEQDSLIIAASPYGGLTTLEEWNAKAVHNGQLFLPVSLHNMIGRIGPLVKPYDSPCLTCLISRENAHLENFGERRRLEATQLQGKAVVAYHQAMLEVVAETAAFEIQRYLHDIPGTLVGSVLRVNLLGQGTRVHRVLKAPRCPTCSSMTGHATLNIFQQLTSEKAWEELEQTGGYRNGG